MPIDPFILVLGSLESWICKIVCVSSRALIPSWSARARARRVTRYSQGHHARGSHDQGCRRARSVPKIMQGARISLLSLADETKGRQQQQKEEVHRQGRPLSETGLEPATYRLEVCRATFAPHRNVDEGRFLCIQRIIMPTGAVRAHYFL